MNISVDEKTFEEGLPGKDKIYGSYIGKKYC